ncbi:hypothetical protein AgCh_021952 [Apium graveolens]
MEVLSAIIHEKSSLKQLRFHSQTRIEKDSHIMFADDILLFCKGDSNSINLLLDAVDQFSGLRRNPGKSSSFFSNVSLAVIHDTLLRSGYTWHCPWSIGKILKVGLLALQFIRYKVGIDCNDVISLAESIKSALALVKDSLSQNSWDVFDSNLDLMIELQNLLNSVQLGTE